eukprot:2253191-Pleurochrysis_carterae.AAC.1
MGRCNGYRPKKADHSEVRALRERLSQCKRNDWQKASYIMRELTMAIGHSGGPSGGLINPRVCSYCDYYGHTKQFCSKLKEDKVLYEKQETDSILEQHRLWLDRHVLIKADRDPDWTAYVQWCDE